MLLLMTLLPFGMWAQTLTVGGVDATDATAMQEAFGSTVTYSASNNTLTLKTPVDFFGSIESSLDQLTIVVSGSNIINGDIHSTNQNATLTFASDPENTQETNILEILNPNQTEVAVIYGFASINLGDMKWQTEGGPVTYKNNNLIEILTGSPALYASLTSSDDVMNPVIWIGTTGVVGTDDDANAGWSFDAGTNTLSLNGSYVGEPIITNFEGTLNVVLSGNITITRDAGAAFIANCSNSKLLFKESEAAAGIMYLNTTTVFDGFASVEYDGNLALKQSSSGYEISSGYGITITTNDGNDINITSSNRQTILDGKIKFDGRNTLILNGADIAGITIASTRAASLSDGLTLYLKGDNKITNGTYAIFKAGNQMPLTVMTNEADPGSLVYINSTCSLSVANDAFLDFTPIEYKNDLKTSLVTETTVATVQVVTIAVPLEPIVSSEEPKTINGGGDGLGKDIETKTTLELTAGVEVNGILYTLPDTYDGYESPEESGAGKKIVAINSNMTASDVNIIAAELAAGTLVPNTAAFAAAFHGMTFKLPAGTGSFTITARTNETGVLNVKIGTQDARQFDDAKDAFKDYTIPYVCTEATYVLIYNTTPAAPSSRSFDDRRAPGRKETTTLGIGGLNISASSVDAVPEPALSPKMLDKSLVATWISGNHVTVNDTDVEDLDDDAFDDLTGGVAASRRAITPSFITYVDLTGTAIKNKDVDRTALPFSKLAPETFIYMPAGNTVKAGTKNVVIGSVCDEMELKQEKQLEVAKNFTALEASLDRTFDTEKTGTIYLPFALDEAKATEMGKFYELTSVEGTTVTMTSVASTKANTPYMFKPAKTKLSAEMVDVKKDVPASPTDGVITFKGTYESKSIVSDGSTQYYCFMADGAKAGKFVHVTGTAVTVSPYRAYMVKLGASARDLDVIIDGLSTGVSVVKDVRSKMDGEFYDLNGRRVMYPTKGLYIVNGKKVIIK